MIAVGLIGTKAPKMVLAAEPDPKERLACRLVVCSLAAFPIFSSGFYLIFISFRGSSANQFAAGCCMRIRNHASAFFLLRTDFIALLNACCVIFLIYYFHVALSCDILLLCLTALHLAP